MPDLEHDFGSVAVGSSTTGVTVSVPANALTLQIVNAQSVVDNGPFAVTHTPNALTATVSFTPTEDGAVARRLRALDSSNVELDVGDLDGTGTIDAITLASRIDLDEASVGASSETTVSIQNDNDFAVSVSISGANASAFSRSPSSVAANATGVITLTFTPPTTQSEMLEDYVATLQLASGDGTLAQNYSFSSASLNAVGINAQATAPTAPAPASAVDAETASYLSSTAVNDTSDNAATRKQLRIYVPDPDAPTALHLGRQGVDSEHDGFGLFTAGNGMVGAEGGILIAGGASAPVYDASTGAGETTAIGTFMGITDALVAGAFAGRATFGFLGTKDKSAHKISGGTAGFGIVLGTIGAAVSLSGAVGGSPPGGVNIYGDGGILMASPMYTSIHSLLGLALTSLYPLMYGMVDAEVFAMNSATIGALRKAAIQSHAKTTVYSNGDVEINARGGGKGPIGSDRNGEVLIIGGSKVKTVTKEALVEAVDSLVLETQSGPDGEIEISANNIQRTVSAVNGISDSDPAALKEPGGKITIAAPPYTITVEGGSGITIEHDDDGKPKITLTDDQLTAVVGQHELLISDDYINIGDKADAFVQVSDGVSTLASKDAKVETKSDGSLTFKVKNHNVTATNVSLRASGSIKLA